MIEPDAFEGRPIYRISVHRRRFANKRRPPSVPAETFKKKNAFYAMPYGPYLIFQKRFFYEYIETAL